MTLTFGSRVATTVGIALLASHLLPDILYGQVVNEVVRGTPSCASCAIELTRVASLGGTTASAGLLSDNPWLAVDSKGRFFVGPSATPGEILVFDRSGRMEQRLGRFGRGPGEMESIASLWMGPGDTLHVFDNARRSSFMPNLSFKSAVPARSGVVSAIFYSNGVSVQQFTSSTPIRHGDPFHILSRSGLITRSFGLSSEDSGYGPANDTYSSKRPLAQSSGSTFWSIRGSQYVLEKWDTTGRLLQRISREVEWFPSWRGRQRQGRTLAIGIKEDSDGRLWILLNPSGRLVLEVLDPDRNRILASREISGILLRHFAGEYLMAYREGPGGEALIDVYRFALRESDVSHTPKRKAK